MVVAALRVKDFLKPATKGGENVSDLILHAVGEVMNAAFEGLCACDEYAGKLDYPTLQAIRDCESCGEASVSFKPDCIAASDDEDDA